MRIAQHQLKILANKPGPVFSRIEGASLFCTPAVMAEVYLNRKERVSPFIGKEFTKFAPRHFLCSGRILPRFERRRRGGVKSGEGGNFCNHVVTQASNAHDGTEEL